MSRCYRDSIKLYLNQAIEAALEDLWKLKLRKGDRHV